LLERSAPGKFLIKAIRSRIETAAGNDSIRFSPPP
jgi:hypothetical protein